MVKCKSRISLAHWAGWAGSQFVGRWVFQFVGGLNDVFQWIFLWVRLGGWATAAMPMGRWSLRTPGWGRVQGHNSVWRLGEARRKSITEGESVEVLAGHGVRVEE